MSVVFSDSCRSPYYRLLVLYWAQGWRLDFLSIENISLLFTRRVKMLSRDHLIVYIDALL